MTERTVKEKRKKKTWLSQAIIKGEKNNLHVFAELLDRHIIHDGKEGRRSVSMIALLRVCFSARPDGINLLLSRLCVNNCSQLGPANRNSILSGNSKSAKIPVIKSFSLQLKHTGHKGRHTVKLSCRKGWYKEWDCCWACVQFVTSWFFLFLSYSYLSAFRRSCNPE